jgi:hypothetical protein
MTLVIDTIRALQNPARLPDAIYWNAQIATLSLEVGRFFLVGVANPSVNFSNNAQSPYSFPRSAGKLGEGARVWIENHV